jgi:hypothetical protein
VTEPSAQLKRREHLRFGLLVAGAGLIVLAVVTVVLSRLRESPTPRRAWAKLAGELAPDQMNVIFVTADTLRADRLSERANLGSVQRDVAGPLGYCLLADLLNRTGRQKEAARAAEAGRRIEAEQNMMAER